MESRASVSHRDAVPRTERGAGDGDLAQGEELVWRPKTRGAGAVPERERESAAAVPRDRNRAVLLVLTVVLAAAALFGIGNLGPVHRVLLQSFTQVGSPSMQFYLNGDPWVVGEFLNVPLGMIVQDDPGAVSFQVHVWTVSAAGKTDASTAVTLPVQNGKGAVNFSLPIPTDAQLVWAQVEGTSLSVHYRFAGSALPTPSASR